MFKFIVLLALLATAFAVPSEYIRVRRAPSPQFGFGSGLSGANAHSNSFGGGFGGGFPGFGGLGGGFGGSSAQSNAYSAGLGGGLGGFGFGK